MPKYDLTIAGAGLGGLSVAALMSRSGKKVIILESGASLDAALGVRAFDGFLFSQGTTLFSGDEQGGSFSEVFTEFSSKPVAPEPVHCFQVALPDRRITVSANQAETHAELKREFPMEIESIEKCYHDIKKESERIQKSRIAAYFAKHKRASGFIGNYHLSREFTIFLEMQSLFFFRKPLSQLSLTKLITLLDTMPARFHHGSRALADRLLTDFRKSGGDIAFGEGTAEIAFKKGRLFSIKTERREIEAKAVLLSVPHQQTPVYFLGIRDNVVPVSMAQDVLYLPDYSRSDEFFFISISADNDISSAPMGARTLTVSLRSPNNRRRDQDDFIVPLADIVPFLEENVMFMEPSPVISPSFKLSDVVKLKAIRSTGMTPLLFKTSKRNLYMLHDTLDMPQELMNAVRKFVATNL